MQSKSMLKTALAALALLSAVSVHAGPVAIALGTMRATSSDGPTERSYGGIVSAEIATGFVNVVQGGNYPNGELGVCLKSGLSTECARKEMRTPQQLLKALYPLATYIGFEVTFNGIRLYYKVR